VVLGIQIVASGIPFDHNNAHINDGCLLKLENRVPFPVEQTSPVVEERFPDLLKTGGFVLVIEAYFLICFEYHCF